jgi:hypothetical protein
MVLVRALFKRDTTIKQKLADSSVLPTSQRQEIPRGTLLVLQSYASPSQNHIKMSFTSLDFQNFTGSWFAFTGSVLQTTPNGEIFTQEVDIIKKPLAAVKTIDQRLSTQTNKTVVNIPANQQTIGSQQGFLKIVFNTDTFIKRQPVAKEALLPNLVQAVPAGTELILSTNSPNTSNVVGFSITSNHVQFSLKGITLNGFGQNWYAFTQHVGIELAS